MIARIVKCNSHRARERLLRAFSRKLAYEMCGGLYGSYYVTEEESVQARKIKGVSIARERVEVHPSLLT